jgi:hypothetical protein
MESQVKSGRMAQPTIGAFRNGCGEFFDQETLNGWAIFVRLDVVRTRLVD